MQPVVLRCFAKPLSRQHCDDVWEVLLQSLVQCKMLYHARLQLMNRKQPRSHQIVDLFIHQFMFSESFACIVLCCQRRLSLFLKFPRVAFGFLRKCGLPLFVVFLFPMLTQMLHFYFPQCEARSSFHVRLQLAAFLELF